MKRLILKLALLAMPAIALLAQDAISYNELAALIDNKDAEYILIDVRTEEEFQAGAIPTAINIPYDVIADNLPTADRSAKIILYCRSGRRSGIADQTLIDLGYTDVTNFGGINRWRGDVVSQ